jgi:hypothetical protein
MEDSGQSSLAMALGADAGADFKGELITSFCGRTRLRIRFAEPKRAIPIKSIAPTSGTALFRLSKPTVLTEFLNALPHTEALQRLSNVDMKITRLPVPLTVPPRFMRWLSRDCNRNATQ